MGNVPIDHLSDTHKNKAVAKPIIIVWLSYGGKWDLAEGNLMQRGCEWVGKGSKGRFIVSSNISVLKWLFLGMIYSDALFLHVRMAAAAAAIKSPEFAKAKFDDDGGSSNQDDEVLLHT